MDQHRHCRAQLGVHGADVQPLQLHRLRHDAGGDAGGVQGQAARGCQVGQRGRQVQGARDGRPAVVARRRIPQAPHRQLEGGQQQLAGLGAPLLLAAGGAGGVQLLGQALRQLIPGAHELYDGLAPIGAAVALRAG